MIVTVVSQQPLTGEQKISVHCHCCTELSRYQYVVTDFHHFRTSGGAAEVIKAHLDSASVQLCSYSLPEEFLPGLIPSQINLFLFALSKTEHFLFLLNI